MAISVVPGQSLIIQLAWLVFELRSVPLEVNRVELLLELIRYVERQEVRVGVLPQWPTTGHEDVALKNHRILPSLKGNRKSN